MKPRVAKYMDHRGDEEEERLRPAAIRPMERGEGIQAASGRRDEASQECADWGPAGTGANSSSVPVEGPLKVRKAPAIEAAARAAAAQRVKAMACSGVEGGAPGGSGVQRDGGEHHKDGHSPFNKFMKKRVSKFFESMRQQGSN